MQQLTGSLRCCLKSSIFFGLHYFPVPLSLNGSVITITTTMASFFITGASRGFGLALARELASRPSSEVGTVIASTRVDSSDLDELVKSSSNRVIVVKLDVANEASIKSAAAEVEKKLSGKGLDVLLNNAGICQYASDGVKSM